MIFVFNMAFRCIHPTTNVMIKQNNYIFKGNSINLGSNLYQTQKTTLTDLYLLLLWNESKALYRSNITLHVISVQVILQPGAETQPACSSRNLSFPHTVILLACITAGHAQYSSVDIPSRWLTQCIGDCFQKHLLLSSERCYIDTIQWHHWDSTKPILTARPGL